MTFIPNKLMINTLLMFIVSILLYCGSVKKQGNTNLPLINCWTHSYEEDVVDAEDVYRPCDYMEFPLSRFRSVYNFKENGECQFLVLAPNDAHRSENGKWEFDKKMNLIRISNIGGDLIKQFEVIEILEDEKLILKP